MLALIFVNGAATVAPVLSVPVGAENGATGYTGQVTTDTGNGTLYFYPSENSSETAATIKASGFTQPVTASGVQNVSGSGLTPETVYYLHYVQDNETSQESNVVSSGSFTTTAAAEIVPIFDEAEWWVDEKRKKAKSIDRQNAARRPASFFEGEGFSDTDDSFDIL